MILFWICVALINIINTDGKKNELRMCDPRNEETVDPSDLYILNSKFPVETSPRNCECRIQSAEVLNLTLISVTSTSSQHLDDADDSVLQIAASSSGRDKKFVEMTAWKYEAWLNIKNYGQATITEGRIIWIKTTGNETSQSRLGFAFKLENKMSSRLIVHCALFSDTNATSTSSDTSQSSDGGALEYLGELCSPAVMILLISLSVALMVIILIVSIILCCIVPKKQRRQIQKIRQTILLENGRPETRVYDECFIPDF